MFCECSKASVMSVRMRRKSDSLVGIGNVPEDLFMGGCMAEAGMRAHAHPCFFTLQYGGIAHRHMVRCACPASVHPLKTAVDLANARIHTRSRCVTPPVPVPSRHL